MSIKIGDEVRVVDWGFAYHSDIALICRFRGGNPFPYTKESMNPSINYKFRRFTDEKKYYVICFARHVRFHNKLLALIAENKDGGDVYIIDANALEKYNIIVPFAVPFGENVVSVKDKDRICPLMPDYFERNTDVPPSLYLRYFHYARRDDDRPDYVRDNDICLEGDNYIAYYKGERETIIMDREYRFYITEPSNIKKVPIPSAGA